MALMTDVYVVIDLDRTLFDTSRFADATMQILVRKGVDQEKIKAIKTIEFQERGNAFDLFAEIRRQGEEVTIDDFIDHPEQYIYRGVNELLGQLQEKEIPYTILTYGEQMTQSLKITLLERALGYKVNALITSEKNKSAWIHQHSTVEDNEWLVLPAELTSGYGEVKTKHVVILDDKPANFDTNSSLIGGILIDNSLSETKTNATAIWDVSLEDIVEA